MAGRSGRVGSEGRQRVTMNAVSPCLLCGGVDLQVHPHRDAKDGKSLPISACRTCGMVQLATIPTDAELTEFYAQDYRKTYRGSATPKLRNVYKAGRNATARLAQFLPKVAPGATILDIGAGGGEFIYLAQRAGLKASGIDPNGEYVDYARSHLGVDLTRAEVVDLPAESRYDVITMFHVLEHLAHPRDVFAQVAGLLNPGGFFVIEVPNIASAQLSPANTFFKAHIAYYSDLTLHMMASEHFEVETIAARKELFAVFRKRAEPVAPENSLRAQSKELTRQRLSKQGWGEYLSNGGALSAFRHIRLLLETRAAIRGRSPKEILDFCTNASA